MISIRIEDKPAFIIVGRKTWISGQDNEQFALFWQECHDNGMIKTLRDASENTPGKITKANIFGVSCVEKDPNNRAFDFYIAAEKTSDHNIATFETYTIPSCTWAIFQNKGELPMSLIDAEMYAFMQWLPSSIYQHAHAPELEVYPAYDDSLVEFWLPIEEK